MTVGRKYHGERASGESVPPAAKNLFWKPPRGASARRSHALGANSPAAKFAKGSWNSKKTYNICFLCFDLLSDGNLLHSSWVPAHWVGGRAESVGND